MAAQADPDDEGGKQQPEVPTLLPRRRTSVARLSLQQGWGCRGGAPASGKQVDAAEGGSLSGARMEPGLAAGHRSRKALLEKRNCCKSGQESFHPQLFF